MTDETLGGCCRRERLQDVGSDRRQAPLLARIAELEAKLAESERIAGILREQRNKAEDELRGRA